MFNSTVEEKKLKKSKIIAAFNKKTILSKAEDLLVEAYNNLDNYDYKECEKAYDEWIESDLMLHPVNRFYPKLPYGRMDIRGVTEQERKALGNAAREYLTTRTITTVCPRCGSNIVYLLDDTYEIVRCVKEGCIGRLAIGI